LGVALAGCPKRNDKPKTIEPAGKRDAASRLLPDDDGGLGILPPPPPVPAVPMGLPIAPDRATSAASVALGELLFHDPRLAQGGKLACASCHDPEHGYAGAARQDTAARKPNLRRAPALVNLAWQTEFGWDGRYSSLTEQLRAHIRGQLGEDLDVARFADVPRYRAHFARISGTPTTETALAALADFTLTRYDGDSPWDRVERSPDAPAEIKAGYQLFVGKAQCSSCHVPPLYTDLRYHRLGLIAQPDDGRGRVDASQLGAFKTPTVRGAARRNGFFHDGSATTLDAAIDWHLEGGTRQGADPKIIDPVLKRVALTPVERGQLGAFVRALASDAAPPTKPVLP
jgi:cytochrome c peroxidase